MPDISPAYLQRRVKEVDPDWVCGPVPTKPRFTQEDKEKRVKWCQEHLDKPYDYWYDWVMFDEFTVYEKPEPQTAIHRKGDGYFRTDPRVQHFSFGNYGKLSLCIAVNPLVGLVGMWWLHSTDGYQGRKIYYVSAPTLQCLHLGL